MKKTIKTLILLIIPILIIVLFGFINKIDKNITCWKNKESQETNPAGKITNINGKKYITEEMTLTDVYRLKNPFINEIHGDLNGDGKIDKKDLDLLITSCGKCWGRPGFIGDADLDSDSCVTNDDFQEWYRLKKKRWWPF